MTDVNSLSSASAVPAHEISSTDEDLASQMSTLCNIDPRTNSISFIDRLPIETLEAIFIHTACSYFRKDDGLPIPTPPTWVSVSYVCSHWRNVALSSPTLWSYLFVTSPRWTEELLSRSKQAPLKLHMTSYRSDKTSTSRALRFLEQVVNYAERIQEIRLYLPLWPTRKTLQFFFQTFLERTPSAIRDNCGASDSGVLGPIDTLRWRYSSPPYNGVMEPSCTMVFAQAE